MNWEEKFQAILCLGETALRMRKPGDWYVDARDRGVVGDGFVRGVYGNGPTPEAAIEDDWKQLTGISSGFRIRIHGGREVRWQGFMWVDCVTPRPPSAQFQEGES